MSTTQTTLIATHTSNSDLFSSLAAIWEGGMRMRVQNLVSSLTAKGIKIIEWDTLLYNRYNASLVVIDYSFLVDDDLMEAACQFTEDQGFPPSESRSILVQCRGRYETTARHFGLSRQRVNLFPKSFFGFRADELCLAPFNVSDECTKPASVLIVKPAPLVASLVRLMSQLHPGDPLRGKLEWGLITVITSSLFDMSYEGDYMVLEEENEEDLQRERIQAIQQYQTWEGWRDEEMWIAGYHTREWPLR